MRLESNRVVVTGAGGNIGSHLVPHLGRLPQVEQVTLIDRDVYESDNVRTQDITPCDVGKAKAKVQAERLKNINPALKVVAITAAVESIPLGLLRGDVIIAALDSRRARQTVNQAAWHLGVPWIDTGVEGGGLLARVNVYLPGQDNPCLECAWDERDYRLIEQSYPCLGFVAKATATGAPSSLGALAAALAAIECKKILAGEFETALVNKQVLIDATHHRHYVTSFGRNPACRFADHAPWIIERLDCGPKSLTIADAFKLGESACDFGLSGIRVEGQPFVKKLTCIECGNTRTIFRLRDSLIDSDRVCERCAKQMVIAGLDQVERLSAAGLAEEQLSSELESIGLRVGDVFSVGSNQTEIHYEIRNDCE